MSPRHLGCAAIVLVFAVVVATMLYQTRSETRDRGLRLENLQSGAYTFDAWSYGNWKTSREGTLTIATFEPPYTLVLAIRPADARPATIEILEAELVESGKGLESLFAKIVEPIDEVKMRRTAAIREPYAAFCFKDAIQSHETITLEVKFQVSRENELKTVTEQLTIPAYEAVTRSFTFWERLMSV